MSDTNYTHLTLVVDRSGSMEPLAVEATGGIATLLQDQFAEEGRLTVTLTEFDAKIETVGRLMAEPFSYTLVPRGMTALLDAVGGELQQTAADIEAMPEESRPGRVLFVIVTDGLENSSREYTLSQVRRLIDEKRAADWDFQFIGTWQAVSQADQLGIDRTEFDASAPAMSASYEVMNESLKGYRRAPVKPKFSMPAEIKPDKVIFDKEDEDWL